MKKISLFLATLVAPLALMAQTTVFNDTFAAGGLSTLNPTAASPGTLTATQTAYEIVSSKNATITTIVSGAFNLSTAATGSGYTEAQAVFTAAPITLNAAGQYIEVHYTLKARTNIFNGLCGNNMEIGVGLFNSGGSAPTNAAFNGSFLWNGGLGNVTNSWATNGACKNWVGYNAQFAFSSNSVQSSAIAFRPVQTGTNNLNQGLGYNSGYSGGANLNTMAGIVGQPTLTVGSQYTVSLKITYVNSTTLAITNTLYNGAGIGGTVFSAGGWTGQFGTTTSGILTNSFDALVINYRPSSSPQTTNEIDSVTVIDNITPPTGPSFTVTGGGVGCSSASFLVGLSGSVTTNDYYLYTNSVSSGQRVTGTGSAFNFGYQSTVGIYTVLASNTVNGSTALMNGSVTISVVPGPCISAPAVFTDNFNSGSTVNGTSTPGGTTTASSTSYDLASTKTVTNAIASGHLKLGLSAATGTGLYEAQAVFAATPVALVTAGDYITFTYSFTDSANLLAGGTASFIYAGLYNSGGAVPVAGSLAAAGLTSTSGSAYAAGNCSNWVGYVPAISGSGGNGSIFTRPSQNAGGTASANQELVANGAGGGCYNNPTGVGLGTEVSGVTLTTGQQYTLSCTIALNADGSLTITNNLYDNTSTLIFSQTNTAAGTNVLTQSFDSLCIGVRNSGTSLNPVMDINQIIVSASIAGLPGPSFSVTGGGTDCTGNSILVGLSGSVSTNDYRLYTNGVFSGVVQTGTGSAFNFPARTVLSVAVTNTVVASNTVSGVTGLMSGSAVIAPLAGPAITTQPLPVVVATNSVGVFTVVASGSGLGYQWYKNNGTKLADTGDVAGSSTTTLVISPATVADAATTAQGYYCMVTNTCGSTAISVTNSLTLSAPGNIVWQGGNPNTNWDFTTANFTNSGGTAVVFHGGDKVTFDDSSTNPVVTIASSLLAPTLITESASQNYTFTGTGAVTGSGALLKNGPGTLTISNANTYTGGTTISNGTVAISGAGTAIGTGPLTLAGGVLETKTASGSASAGLNNINVTANSTLQYDANGTYALVILGPITGSSGATLTIYNYLNSSSTSDRVRLYGTFTNNSPIVLSTLGNLVEMSPYNSAGVQVFNGVISGNGGRFTPRGNGSVIFNTTNTFNDSGVTGGSGASGYSVYMSSGNVGVGADSVSTTPPTIDASPLGTGNLGINVGTEGGNCSLFASGGAHTVANPVIYTSATNTVILSITGSNNLTLSGPFTLSGADNTGNVNRTIQVNNTGLTTLAGVVGDAGLTCGLIKTGPDSLVLSATNTYTGPTTISAGTLLVNGKLDVGAVTTATTATLGGSGTILGPVTVQGGGILAPGTGAIGTLTINSNLTLAGNALFKVNKAVSPSNDVVAVSGTLTNSGTGTLTVTNLTGSLAVGDQFKLFSTALANGAALTVTGGGVNWTNKLAVDGSIAVLSVISTVATNSTNITFSANSGSLSLSWPVDHLGWSLQVQTNALSTGLGTNWVTVPGSSSVTATNFTINPANGSVFYRLIYTAP